MLARNDCLDLIRKFFPNRAVWNSSKTHDGRYKFVVALGNEIKYDVVDYYEEYIVDPKTGTIERYYWLDNLEDIPYVTNRESIEGTTKWIDGHPPVPPEGWQKRHPQEWKEFQQRWNL